MRNGKYDIKKRAQIAEFHLVFLDERTGLFDGFFVNREL